MATESPLPGHLRMQRVKLGGDDSGHLNLPQVCRILGDYRLLPCCTCSVTLFRPSDAAPEVYEQKVGRGGILGQYPAIVGGFEGKTAPCLESGDQVCRSPQGTGYRNGHTVAPLGCFHCCKFGL